MSNFILACLVQQMLHQRLHRSFHIAQPIAKSLVSALSREEEDSGGWPVPAAQNN